MPAIGTRRTRPNKPTQIWVKDDLKDGTWVDEDGEEALVCDVCGFEAKSAGGLSTHQRTH